MSVAIDGTNGITFNDASVQGAAAIGYGQTYQNVTASRASGTTYTNSTGKSILVTFAINDAGGQPSTLNMFVGGVRVGGTNMGMSAGYPGIFWILLVPNGSTYSISYNASASYAGWWELR